MPKEEKLERITSGPRKNFLMFYVKEGKGREKYFKNY